MCISFFPPPPFGNAKYIKHNISVFPELVCIPFPPLKPEIRKPKITDRSLQSSVTVTYETSTMPLTGALRLVHLKETHSSTVKYKMTEEATLVRTETGLLQLLQVSNYVSNPTNTQSIPHSRTAKSFQIGTNSDKSIYRTCRLPRGFFSLSKYTEVQILVQYHKIDFN